MQLKSKLFVGAVALTMVLGMAIPASAATSAELTAQINALLAQIAQLQAQIGGGTTVAATTFTSNLTVGSKGAEVSALQSFLVGKGFLTMPAGVAMGTFGPLTKSALAAYQSANGISPAAGYFGPVTRAKVNAAGAVSTGGTTTGGTTTGGSTGITTPGAEGTITASESSSGVLSTLYEGDTMKAVLGIKLDAKSSDMAFQRLKLDLDDTGSAANDTMVYNKLFSRVSLTDENGNVLASSALNSSTVVKDGTDYFITLSGFSYVIPKGTSKVVLVKVDVYPTIDTTDLVAATHSPTISVASNGIRAVDGAGIDQYSGTTAISANPVISADLTDSATLSVSLNSSTPKKGDVVCTSGTSENECDKLTLLVFDLKAEKDSVKITDLNIAVAKTGSGGATASTTVRLFDGSTELASASIGSLNTAIFNSFDYTIAKDTTKTLTVKADIRGATGVLSSFTASASSTGITDENSRGDAVTDSGTATGNAIGVTHIGPEFTIVNSSITTSGVPQSNDSVAGYSTSTLTATFNIKVKAVGGALEFGINQATTSPLIASSTTYWNLYRDGSVSTALGSYATSTSITFPSTCSTSGFTGQTANTCQLAEGSETTVAVSFQIMGRTPASVFTSGLYSVGIARLDWQNATAGTRNTTFMAGEANWRTTDVSFP
jgi:hypothetical protein